MGYNLT